MYDKKNYIYYIIYINNDILHTTANFILKMCNNLNITSPTIHSDSSANETKNPEKYVFMYFYMYIYVHFFIQPVRKIKMNNE